MDAKDIADLLLATVSRIEFYWNLYVGALIAMSGWLISMRRPLTRPMKNLITIGYLVLAAMNLFLLLRQYSGAEALRNDLLLRRSDLDMPHTTSLLERGIYLQLRWVAIIVHVIMGVAFLAVVWHKPWNVNSDGTTDKKNMQR